MQLTNLIQSPYDARDYQYNPVGIGIPNKVDLRHLMTPLEHQYDQGSCVMNAIPAALEAIKNTTGSYDNLSRQFGYNVVRKMENRMGQEGTWIRDGLEMSRKVGFCLETEFTYGGANAEADPPKAAYDSALQRRVTRYESVPIIQAGIDGMMDSIRNIKSALSEGLMPVFAMKLGDKYRFLSGPLDTHNYISFSSGLPGTHYIGNHAQVIVGFDDTLNRGSFIVSNSWGIDWGDKGYAAVPYAIVQDFIEAWAIRGFQDVNLTNTTIDSQRRKIVQLYVTLFGRCPDRDGLLYWSGMLETKPPEKIADDMLEMSVPLFPSSLSNDTFINRLYPNALGRSVDVAGLSYWTQQLNGGMTRGQVAQAIINAVDASQNVYFMNKVALGMYFAVDLACNSVSLAEQSMKIITDQPSSLEEAKSYIRKHVGAGIL